MVECRVCMKAPPINAALRANLPKGRNAKLKGLRRLQALGQPSYHRDFLFQICPFIV